MSTFPPGAHDPPPRRRILLVEDNPVASRSLARLLEAWGFEVTVRPDGASALRALELPPPPDFLLTDLRLPDIDGREIARHSRGLVPPPRVALITGWDLDADPAEYAKWGIDWVFPKPVDIKKLVARLRAPGEGPE
jgi:DNA-binding response OmpR family regulator